MTTGEYYEERSQILRQWLAAAERFSGGKSTFSRFAKNSYTATGDLQRLTQNRFLSEQPRHEFDQMRHMRDKTEKAARRRHGSITGAVAKIEIDRLLLGRQLKAPDGSRGVSYQVAFRGLMHDLMDAAVKAEVLDKEQGRAKFDGIVSALGRRHADVRHG